MELQEGLEEDHWLANFFATSAHDGQVRRATGDPYITHPRSVAKIVDSYGGTEDQINAAICHDSLEDTEATWEELRKLFNEHVADIVSELTNSDKEIKKLKKKYNGNNDKAKEEYMNKHLLELSNDALLIKLADNYANVCDSPRREQAQRIKNNILLLRRNRHLTQNMKDLCAAVLTRINAL
jgi:(p)ppGpp synthase/HD superfamily hydrolase